MPQEDILAVRTGHKILLFSVKLVSFNYKLSYIPKYLHLPKEENFIQSLSSVFVFNLIMAFTIRI